MESRTPLATYRLQLNHQFTFKDAQAILDYLSQLGVTDCYLSPIMRAAPGSVHGYDVVDHSQLNPELGGEADFTSFAQSAKERGLGLLMDIVPNHMCISDEHNQWWQDVLENGHGAFHARFFDIDWKPPKRELANKVSLPVLGDQYGKVLENGDIHLILDGGRFGVEVYNAHHPLTPRSWRLILSPALSEVSQTLKDDDPSRLELESIIAACANYPPTTDTAPEKIRERWREKEILARRISTLINGSDVVKKAVEHTVRTINGEKGKPRSFDALENILAEQAYRLCFWRVAADEINYRRFFDIKELAAIRVEDDIVFERVHRLALQFVSRGWVSGLRIDHVDGLYDPDGYLRSLQSALSERTTSSVEDPFYLIVEKIFSAGEKPRKHWPVFGTTGYDFMNTVNGLFVERSNEKAFRRIYQRFTSVTLPYSEIFVICKKLIMLVSFPSEVRVLSVLLDRISEQHRWSRDFTQESLRFALREVIACFPVYRSYIRLDQKEPEAADREFVVRAIADAKRRNPATDESIFDFIADVLLLKDPDGLTESEIQERRRWVMRFQQMTGPIMAKGIEDTAFYRYFPLASINEVGGNPEQFGITPTIFHRQMKERAADWPLSLSASSTHDTKRSEDVRARINVLSEIPSDWERAIKRWREMNKKKKTHRQSQFIPDGNEEYLLYQTLFGTWPLNNFSAVREDYVRRIQGFMSKAMKEAKLHTSWIKSDEEYEKAVLSFVENILRADDGNSFVADFAEFEKKYRRAGLLNALCQTVIKLTAPGVPDFYQGTEIFDFSLVDPDNRRPVDYTARRQALEQLPESTSEAVSQFLQTIEDGRIKLFLVRTLLRLRKQNPELFRRGDYSPLIVAGKRQNNVIAFARKQGERTVIVITGRFFTRLPLDPNGACNSETWDDSSVELPADFGSTELTDAITGRSVAVSKVDGRNFISLAPILVPAPFAVLTT